jgi:pyridoxamine 5'-phosphate oxidase
MNLTDLAVHHDPLEPYLAFHRRIERHLAGLVALAGRLDAGEMDAQAAAQAAALAKFFGEALPRHHEEEERDLLPLLESRIVAGPERGRLRELRDDLRADHRELDGAWKRIAPSLETLAEGLARRLAMDLVQYYRAIHSVHIAAEEVALHRAVLRWRSREGLFGGAARARPRHGIVTPLP